MKPSQPPGRTRRRVYEFVRKRLLRGDPPTVREVQAAFHFKAVQSAREHLEALVTDGLLAKAPGRARGYRLPDDDNAAPAVLVPLLGRVQAGSLTTALEEPEGYLSISFRSSSSRDEQRFALRVRGDSMTGAGILDGDVVFVRRQSSADDGDVVVAIVGDEATVKTFRRRPAPTHQEGRAPRNEGRVELHPANPDFAVIVPPPDELHLLGKVIEVRRYLEEMPLITDPFPREDRSEP